MRDRDTLRRFLFEQLPIRGFLVHMDASWTALLEHRDYPDAVRVLLGEVSAAALLLAATIKFDGVLSLQLQGDGPVHLLLAQCTSGFGVRGLARFRPEAVAAASQLAQLVGAGNLTVSLEGDGVQPYHGVVPIAGAHLAEALQNYFANSEQLPTRLWLHADARGAFGMLLQRLPPERSVLHSATVDGAIDDAWRRLQLIGDTLTSEEMNTLDDAQILHRLFNEDDVRLFEPAPVFFRCRCTRERVAGMLQALGESEVHSILAERGEVEVRCDFCNRAFQFDAVDAAQLFKAALAAESGSSVH